MVRNAVVRGQVYTSSVSEFRSRLDRVAGKGLEDAGLQRLDVYLDGSAVYLALEHGAREPTEVLREHDGLRPWRDLLSKHTTILREPEPMEPVVDRGELPRHPQFLKLVTKKGHRSKLLDHLHGLVPSDVEKVGLRGIRAWTRDEEVVIEAGATPEDLAWLERPVDAWDGASFRALLSGTTDLLPGSRGHRVLSRVQDTEHGAGLPEAV